MPGISEEDRDRLSPVWDMSQERAFLENLLGQRFNFFLIFFSVVVAGAVNAKSQRFIQIILTTGTLICWLLASTLMRAQKKLDIILQILFRDPTHPAAISNTQAGKGSRRKIIGFVIPILCCALLTLGMVLAWFNIFPAGPPDIPSLHTMP